MVETRKYN